MTFRPHISVRVLVLLAASLPGRADAQSVPPIAGHVTDVSGSIAADEKETLEGKLGALQNDAKVDVAVLVSNAPPQDLASIGRRAYESWRVGHAWKNGILLSVSANSHAAEIIVLPERPALSPAEVERVRAAYLDHAAREVRLAPAIQAAAERIGEILRPQAHVRERRPPGQRHFQASVPFSLAAAAVVVAAVFVTFGQSKRRQSP